jgi:deoxyhypusine synthase|tara:strand:- start:37823 stop:38059 length:237 start_codon:yes stop_codon:yes gene_type:complete
MINSTISLQDKKEIIIDFLKQCNSYSEQMLDKYSSQLVQSDLEGANVVKQKIHDWTTYREFNDYAIGELKGEQLDDWF